MHKKRNQNSSKQPVFTAVPWRIHLLVGGVGLIVIGIVVYGFYIGERLTRLDEPLIDAVREIRLEAETADIWLNEVIRGNLSGDFKTIWEHLDQSVWYLKSLNEESNARKNVFGAMGTDDIRRRIIEIQRNLSELKDITGLVLASVGTSGFAKGMQLRYEEIYAAFLDQVGQLESRLVQTKASNLKQFRYLHLVLIVTCILLFLSIGGAFQFFFRHRSRHYQRMQLAKEGLEKEVSKREKVQAELQKAHNQLEERVIQRTEELSLTNKMLIGEIDERSRVEDLLRQSKSMLQAVFDGISDPLILFDRDMVIKMVNRSAAEYYQINKFQDAVGNHCYQIHGQGSICEGCPIPEAIVDGRHTMFERQGFMNKKNLEQVTIYPVESSDGISGDALIRINDITEMRLFERQLIQSEKMASLGVLVSSIAHEINNPNNFVSFNIPILRDYIEDLLPVIDEYSKQHPDLEICRMPYRDFREDIFKLLDNINHGSGRISAFVANLREYAQSDGNLSKRYVDLKAVLDKVVAICRSKIKQSVKSFEINSPPDLPQIYTEPYTLEQVLISLLVNAAQATDKQESWVKLNVSLGSNWKENLRIEVVDNGCGIDENLKRNIFDPFYTTKSRGDGTGLGLYICHNLIQGLGGRIDVKSEPGQGSRFTVLLPDKDRRKKPRI